AGSDMVSHFYNGRSFNIFGERVEFINQAGLLQLIVSMPVAKNNYLSFQLSLSLQCFQLFYLAVFLPKEILFVKSRYIALPVKKKIVCINPVFGNVKLFDYW